MGATGSESKAMCYLECGHGRIKMLTQNSPFVTLLPPMVTLLTADRQLVLPLSFLKSQFGELGSMDVALWNY